LTILAMLTLATLLGTGAVRGAHTLGTLDCGQAGVFDVAGHLPAGGPPIDRPSPWSGIFLLEDTTRVFRAFANTHFDTEQKPATTSPRPLITCTLRSVGPMFDPEWTLVGMLLP
jgi:hypothetical protein